MSHTEDHMNFGQYGNYETMTVALILENEVSAHSKLLEMSCKSMYGLKGLDIKNILSVSNPARVFKAWPEDGLDLSVINFDVLAKEWNETAREINQASLESGLPGIIDVLRNIEYAGEQGQIVCLNGQLDRKTYQAVDRVLQALGGKWNKKVGGHIFDASPMDEIEIIIETGRFRKPYNFGYFPTPREQAEDAVKKAGLTAGMKVLEPEIGQGHLASVIRDLHPDVFIYGYEINPNNHAIASKRFECELADFLTVRPEQIYDVVIMNPPFEKQQDIAHIEHAMKFLVPGGKLVSIMGAGITFRNDKKSIAFREMLEQHGGKFYENLAGAFKSSGTMVNTITIVVRKAKLDLDCEAERPSTRKMAVF